MVPELPEVPVVPDMSDTPVVPVVTANGDTSPTEFVVTAAEFPPANP